MIDFSADSAPGLLVSVRSAAEAKEALAGGADVIDVKEPTRGSLGAADAATLGDVVRAVSGTAMLTAALGELIDLQSADSGTHSASVPSGISLFKIGLAGCRANSNWVSSWRDAIRRLLGDSNGHSSQSRLVAVVYADWRAANSPAPIDVLDAAVQFGCPALLVDTWDKSSGTLFDHWPVDDVKDFAEEVRSRGIRIVLAGSLTGAALVEAGRLGPDLIAVRTAACDGGRNGAVSRERVQKLKQLLTALTPTSSPSGAKKFP
ncbi:MAG TPA: (5-formylfuran-3-yl)methyl phosphate synthase [Lacipirellulaceae bacterium]|jgi:hypothetical protein|nr:(5-formylfuran-3-yl)methyl phosphate synthase [Lacipirellulaceae bacterium]